MESGSRLGAPKSPVLWFFCVALLLFLAGTGGYAETLGFSLYPDPAASRGEIRVIVLDALSGNPVTEALVTATHSLDSDPESQVKTSADGSALMRFASEADRVVNVSKEGYTSTSIAGLKSSGVTVFLRPYPKPEHVVDGKLNGFPAPNDDSQILTGIVFKSLSIFDLIHFSVQSLLSPLKDEIDVVGPRKIPSNLVLPDQTVSFLFASFHLDKPQFRLPLSGTSSLRLAGAQGVVNVSDATGLANGFKLDFINKIQFSKVGISSPFVPGEPSASGSGSTDFEAGYDLTPYHQVSLARPPFQADVLTAAVIDMNGDRETLMPTDLKVPQTSLEGSGPTAQLRDVSLSTTRLPLGQGKAILTLALADKGKRLSGIYTENAGKTVQPGDFLPVDGLEQPAQLPPSVEFSAPETGIAALTFHSPSPGATLASTALWKIYVLPSAGKARFLTKHLEKQSSIFSYSILKLDFGKAFDESKIDGKLAMRSLNRFASAVARIGGKR